MPKLVELCVQVGPCVLWINFQVQAQTWTLKTSFSLHRCNFVVGWHLFQFSKCHAFCSNFEWSWASEVFWLAGFYFKGLSLTTWALNISVLCLTVSPRFLWLLGCLTSSTPNLHLEISSSVHQYNFCCWWWNRISCSRCHAFCSNLVSAWASLQMFGLTGEFFYGIATHNLMAQGTRWGAKLLESLVLASLWIVVGHNYFWCPSLLGPPNMEIEGLDWALRRTRVVP